MTRPDLSARLDERLADRLRQLRLERGWSLDDLARASGVSRASLSRLEKAEVSPTATVLGRLCAAYRLPVSRLIAMAEAAFRPVLRRSEQTEWSDRENGFTRRSVSPPAAALSGEVIEGRLEAGRRIDYAMPPVPGQEHHLVVLEGALTVTVDGTAHTLAAGDCLRYRLTGSSGFRTTADTGARYLVMLI